MNALKKILGLLLLLAAQFALAEDEGHVHFLKHQSDYVVNADGTYTVEYRVAYRLLTEAALVGSGKMPITYHDRLQQVELLEAFTQKKDGTRIALDASNIQTQQGQLATGYGISQTDQRTMMLTFPQLEVGDSLSYAYRLTQKTPVFPGQFYASALFARGLAWDQIDISIDVPAALTLQTESVKLTSLPVTEHDGRRHYRWQQRRLPVQDQEPGAIDNFASTAHVIATSFKNWRAFAIAYEARARPSAEVTPAIAAAAADITAGVSDPKQRARLSYEWVAKNIRYVATWIGADGWVPHSAEAVLLKRYGDCKDHVVLLEALLAAVGIPSSAVLLNNDLQSYAPPSVAFPSFNHVITYVPQFDLYLDSTAGSSTPFGVLPLADADKPGLHTALLAARNGANSPTWPRTPMANADNYAASRDTQLVLNSNGDATGQFSIRAVGVAAIELRNIQQSIGKGKQSQWVRELFDAQNLEGSGNVSFIEDAQQSAVTMQIDFRIRNFLAPAENGVIPLLPLTVGPIGFDQLRGIYKRAQRNQRFFCPAWLLEDRYQIQVPAGFRLIVPSGRALREASFDYRSEYRVSGNQLTAVRRLAIQRPSLACAPAMYASDKQAVDQIDRDLRAQVIYQFDDSQRNAPVRDKWLGDIG